MNDTCSFKSKHFDVLSFFTVFRLYSLGYLHRTFFLFLLLCFCFCLFVLWIRFCFVSCLCFCFSLYMCVCVFVDICVPFWFLLCLCYNYVILSFMPVYIQVVSRNHQFAVEALPSIFHMASFMFNGKLARDVDLLVDQSEHLPNRISCIKCKSWNAIHFSDFCAFCWWWIFVVLWCFFFSFLFILFCFISFSDILWLWHSLNVISIVLVNVRKAQTVKD